MPRTYVRAPAPTKRLPARSTRGDFRDGPAESRGGQIEIGVERELLAVDDSCRLAPAKSTYGPSEVRR